MEERLPEGWVWTTFSELITLSQNGCGKRSSNEGNFTIVLKLSDIYKDTISLTDSRKIKLTDDEIESYQLLENDLVCIRVNGSRSLVGRMIRFRVLGREPIAYCDHFIRFRSADAELATFLALYFETKKARRHIELNMVSSAGQNTVSQGTIMSVDIPVPPLPEQRRIVAAIEQQFSSLDAAVTSLQHAKAKLKRQRAANLKAAVEGTLTADWRAQHPASETAEQLLQRILHERRAKWEAEQLAKMQAKGVTPKDNKWKDAYKEPEPPDTTNLPKLPEGWVWVNFGQCFEVHVGATPSRKVSTYWGGNIPWVSSGEVQFCHIRSTKEYITEEGLNNSSTQINPIGSVLLGMIGEGRTRGQVAILDIEACNNQNCAAIWVSKTSIFSEFIYYWLWSQYEVTRRGSSGNNQPALNKTRIEEMVFPLVPISEQQQIVSEVEQRLSILTKTEEEVEANLKRAERLRQTILAEAFAGWLVPQDPRDEPASVLLERIRQEREQRDVMQGMHKKGKAGNGRAATAVKVPGEPVKMDVEGMEQVELWESVGG